MSGEEFFCWPNQNGLMRDVLAVSQQDLRFWKQISQSARPDVSLFGLTSNVVRRGHGEEGRARRDEREARFHSLGHSLRHPRSMYIFVLYLFFYCIAIFISMLYPDVGYLSCCPPLLFSDVRVPQIVID